MARKKIFYVPTIDHNRYYVDNAQMLAIRGRHRPLNDFIARNLETQKSISRRRALRHGIGRSVHHVRRKHPRTGLVRQSRYDAGAALKTATVDAADLLARAIAWAV